MKRDKENDVVIMERMRYVEGTHKIIDDNSKLKKTRRSPYAVKKRTTRKISPKTEKTANSH